jgi:hypothetical protein
VAVAGLAALVLACSDPSGLQKGSGASAVIHPLTTLTVTFTGPTTVKMPGGGFVEVNCGYQATASGGSGSGYTYTWVLDGTTIVAYGAYGLVTYSGPWPSNHSLEVDVVDSNNNAAYSIPKIIHLVRTGGTACQPS